MPSDLVEKLKTLPLRPDVIWQGGALPLYGWITDDGPLYRPRVALWARLGRDGGLSPAPKLVRRDEDSLEPALNALAAFVADPRRGGFRPGTLQVKDPDLARRLAEALAGAEIRVELLDEMPLMDNILMELSGRMSLPPGLMDDEGMTVDRVRAFAEAAKLFYEARPWEELANEDVIQIEAPAFQAGLRCAVVMGAGGQQYGLSFYESVDRFLGRYRSGGMPAPDEDPWVLPINPPDETPFADLDLWERHKLPMAGPGLYPVPMVCPEEGGLERPWPALLSQMEGLLRALSETTGAELDSGRWSRTVPTFDGPQTYTLSLPLLLNPLDHSARFRLGLVDMRANECLFAQIDRFVEERDFKDADAMNAAIRKEFTGAPIDAVKYKPRNSLEAAQDLCFQAFESIGRRRRMLARQAIETNPDCADAYCLQAEMTSDPQRKRTFYEQGVSAGKRALGDAFFAENAGRFWTAPGSRPFMRALQGLAETLTASGEETRAVEHYRELLRLNPEDNQGNRYLLLPLLIKLGRDPDAMALWKQHEDEDEAIWTYCGALLSFRIDGDTPASLRLLKRAVKSNRHAPKYLRSKDPLPPRPPHYVPGEEDEAVMCAHEIRPAWEATPGAVEWLRERMAGGPAPAGAGGVEPGERRQRRRRRRK